MLIQFVTVADVSRDYMPGFKHAPSLVHVADGLGHYTCLLSEQLSRVLDSDKGYWIILFYSVFLFGAALHIISLFWIHF